MYRSFLQETFTQTSKMARDAFGNVTDISVKEGDRNQVLTEVDIAIGEYIVARIEAEFPEHNIIDEEAGVIDKGSDTTWVVDPIDGTSNFAAGVPLYGTMIGLLKHDAAVAGGIATPEFHEIITAESGAGAERNGNPVQVSTEDQLHNVLLSYGIDGHPEDPERTRAETVILRDLILNIRNLRTSNSAYDIAQVAIGRYGAMLNQTSKIWDNVAQEAVITEAGGVYDFWGEPIDYSDALARADENFTFCAASPTLHRQIQQLLDEHRDLPVQ